MLQIQHLRRPKSASKSFPDRSLMAVPTALTVLLCLDQPFQVDILLRSKSCCVLCSLDTSSIFHFRCTHAYVATPQFLLYIGFAFSATIERAFVTVPGRLFGDRIFGNAQLTGKTLRIDCTKEPKLIRRLHLSMQSLVAVML